MKGDAPSLNNVKITVKYCLHLQMTAIYLSDARLPDTPHPAARLPRAATLVSSSAAAEVRKSINSDLDSCDSSEVSVRPPPSLVTTGVIYSDM